MGLWLKNVIFAGNKQYIRYIELKERYLINHFLSRKAKERIEQARTCRHFRKLARSLARALVDRNKIKSMEKPIKSSKRKKRKSIKRSNRISFKVLLVLKKKHQAKKRLLLKNKVKSQQLPYRAPRVKKSKTQVNVIKNTPVKKEDEKPKRRRFLSRKRRELRTRILRRKYLELLFYLKKPRRAKAFGRKLRARKNIKK